MPKTIDDDRRHSLAKRACEVLARLGLSASTEQLARELGMKRPTFLYYFPTYAHVVETALVDLLTEQAVFVRTRVDAYSHPIDRLYAQIRSVREFHRGREAQVLFLMQSMAVLGGEQMREIAVRLDDVFGAHRRESVRLVRAGIEQGIVAPCDPEALLAAIRTVIDGAIVQALASDVDLDRMHAFIWDHLLAPLKLAAPVVVASPSRTPRGPRTKPAPGAVAARSNRKK